MQKKVPTEIDDLIDTGVLHISNTTYNNIPYFLQQKVQGDKSLTKNGLTLIQTKMS